MHKSAFLALVALGAACAGGSPASPTPELAPIRLSETGDSVMYLERTSSLTLIERPTDTVMVEAEHTAVIHVMRTAPDTLEAFYEHLILRFATPTKDRNLDTRALIGPRFVLHERDGRIETLRAPEQPEETRQLTDLSRQFDDFFLRIPAVPLAVGTEWVDTVRFSDTEGEGGAERLEVTRFRVTGDTVMHGLAAVVIAYESAIENRLTMPPTTEGTLTATLVGAEEGTFVFAPGREVMLSRSRIGVLEGEILIEGGLSPLRFPQAYSYESTIELIPPALPGAVQPERPAEEQPPRA